MIKPDPHFVLLHDLAQSIFPGLSSYGRSPVGKGTFEVSLLGTSNLQNGLVEIGEPDRVFVEDRKQVERYMVKTGDVLLTVRGSGFRSAVCSEDVSGYLASSNLCVIRLRPDCGIGPYLLNAIFCSPFGQRTLMAISQGSSIVSIRPRALQELMIAVPPSEEAEHLESLCKEMVFLQKSTLMALDIRNRIIGELTGAFIQGRI